MANDETQGRYDWEDFYEEYGGMLSGDPSPEEQAAWDSLGDWGKEHLKQGFAPFEGPGEDTQAIWDELYEQFQSGGPVDWESLQATLDKFEMSPGVRDWFIRQTRNLITGGGTDFAKEYGVGKRALDVQLGEATRGVMESMAARGLLDSSTTAWGVGGAMGGYTRGLADLMMWKGGAEEQSRQFNISAGMNLGSMGLNWAGMDIANEQNLAQLMMAGTAQNQGLGMNLLGYGAEQQNMMNQYNLGQMMNWGWDPTTGLDVAMAFGPPILNAWAGGMFGGGGGGGGGQPQTSQMGPPIPPQQGGGGGFIGPV